MLFPYGKKQCVICTAVKRQVSGAGHLLLLRPFRLPGSPEAPGCSLSLVALLHLWVANWPEPQINSEESSPARSCIWPFLSSFTFFPFLCLVLPGGFQSPVFLAAAQMSLTTDETSHPALGLEDGSQ